MISGFRSDWIKLLSQLSEISGKFYTFEFRTARGPDFGKNGPDMTSRLREKLFSRGRTSISAVFTLYVPSLLFHMLRTWFTAETCQS